MDESSQWPFAFEPESLPSLETAGCFETLADAIALVRQIQDVNGKSDAEFEQALYIAAEAQSALRISIAELDGNPDNDQREVFHWLKQTTTENNISIQRHMRSDDPADPSQWPDMSARIKDLDARHQETRKKLRYQKRSLGKVRHKCSLIANDSEDAIVHWQILARTVDELVDGGLPPSHRELRELLIPVINNLPVLEEMPKGFQLTLREVDRYMATCPQPEATAITPPTQEVLETAKLLNGKAMVLIGGDCRPPAQRAIEEAFGLSELIWIETVEHQSTDTFIPYVARPDVAVVLLAIRWSSHSYGDVRLFCEQHGQPLVRLPGGYNPNQVAAQIMSQCSDRLK